MSSYTVLSAVLDIPVSTAVLSVLAVLVCLWNNLCSSTHLREVQCGMWKHQCTSKYGSKLFIAVLDSSVLFYNLKCVSGIISVVLDSSVQFEVLCCEGELAK